MPMKQVQKHKNTLVDLIDEAAGAIQTRSPVKPEILVILGTGLGNLAKKIKAQAELNYSEIPHFPVSTVESHSGKLILGELAGKKVAAMEGRFHFYEGYDMREVVFPIRVLNRLGAKTLIVSNAAGGLNLSYQKGDLVLIEDHINFMGLNPLIGPNDERVGPRFPDMSDPYSKELRGFAAAAARETGLTVREGVYIGVTGPNLETRAEYRMMRAFGADVVGMSTVPEVIAAVHLGMKVLGVSVVTDVCDPDHLEAVDIKEIIRTANEAGPKLDRLIEEVIRKIRS